MSAQKTAALFDSKSSLVPTCEGLLAEQEVELVQELLGRAVAGDGALVRLLRDDDQVGDRVTVVLVPAGVHEYEGVSQDGRGYIGTICAADCCLGGCMRSSGQRPDPQPMWKG